MTFLPLLALLVGFLIFWVPSQNISANEALARYSAIAILAGFDTILGGLRASMQGKFDNAVFVSGFFVNVLLAAGLLFLGEYFGLEAGSGENRISVMMIAAVVIFSGRILNNLAALRRLIIDRLREKRAAKQNPARSNFAEGEFSGADTTNLVK